MTQMRIRPLIAIAIAIVGLAIGTTTSSAQAQPQGASTPAVGLLHVQRNVHMLVVNGMNIAVQVGDDGVLLVDAATAAVAPQVITAIRTLSPKPIHTIINTHVHAGSHRRQRVAGQAARHRRSTSRARHRASDGAGPNDRGCAGRQDRPAAFA